MAFSATDAAFEGFRIARERPMAIVLWAIVYLGFALISGIAMFLLVGSELMAVIQAGEAASSDPDLALALVSKMQGMNLISLPISLLSTAVFSAAVYRAVLRPQESRFGYLRLGGDELRLILLYLVMTALILAAAFAFALVMGLIVGGAGLAAISGGDAQAGVGVGFGVLFGFLAVLAFVGLCIWVAVRLSLAAPMTFAEGRLRIFESWTATKGHFWPLFGAYLLAAVLALMVATLGVVIVLAIVLAAVGGGAALTGGGQPDFAALAGPIGVAGIVSLLIVSILVALYYAIILAPSAVAYRELVGRDDAAAS